MPKLLIDNIEVEVPAGTNVLEAAKKVGIWIPHFCYHPALGSVGACRLCAMKFLEGPVKGIQMSCMIPAQDGMVISTSDPEVLRLRQLVIEWLMINHPHDCPVCDEGGECLLQDYTIAGGHGIRRYKGKKHTFLNQDLGPYIEHEMNRCIECYRCVRFYQEFAGGDDLGVMGSAARVYFGRFQEGKLDSPFSGNLVDLCPTGVYTDKTARFRARYWDYDMAPSVCPWCSLGCNTIPAARYRELLKTMARRNDAVNGWFICDRGRFGNAPVNDPARPRTPLLEGREADWEEALDALVTRIAELHEVFGDGCLALVGSPRLALEGAALMPRLAELLGAGFLCYFTDQKEGDRAVTAVSHLNSGNSASMADVQGSDCIAVLNSELLDEGPLMALTVRQAWRKGAKVFLVGGSSTPEWAKAVAIEAVAANTLSAVPFADYKRPVVVCGTRQNDPSEMERAAQAGAKVAYLFSGPNACGAALLAKEHETTSLTQAVALGKVKGILAIEADIPAELLEGVSFVAAADWLPSGMIERANIFLPTTSWVEMDGTYVNNEGRGQRFQQVMKPGLPIKGLDPALHPPRMHRLATPGGDLHPAWQVIAKLIQRLGGDNIAEPLAGRWEKLGSLPPEGEGMRIL
jgi:NADH-quinone oxidoreductase subunit G